MKPISFLLAAVVFWWTVPAAAMTLESQLGDESVSFELTRYDSTFAASVENAFPGSKTCDYFMGRAEQGWSAAFRLCGDDWQGYATGPDANWVIDESLEGRRLDSEVSCALSDRTGALADPSDPLIDLNDRRFPTLVVPRYIELGIITDPEFERRRQLGEYELDIPMILLGALSYFQRSDFRSPISLVIKKLERFPDEAPWGAPSSEPNQYSRQLSNWASDGDSGFVSLDALVLLTGVDLSPANGIATIGGACERDGGSAVVTYVGNDVSLTLAHEIGHLLGSDHDGVDDSCPRRGFVMGPSASGADFSTCSINSIEGFLATRGTCIDASASYQVTGPICGDGRVEPGEQCDCGPEGCPDNKCCDAATCQFTEGARCAADDPCCSLETCQPVSADANRICREASSSCDTPEYCTGGAVCPDDLVEPVGTPCADGMCYQGDCVTRATTCEVVGPDFGLPDPPYDPLCDQSDDCGVASCAAPNTEPVACVETAPNLVDGTPCSIGQCLDGECRESDTIRTSECVGLTDYDDDGVDGCGDDRDGCPLDPDKTAPGECGCLRPETPDCEPVPTGNDEDDVVIEYAASDQSDQGCGCGAGGPLSPVALLLAGAWLIGRQRRRTSVLVRE